MNKSIKILLVILCLLFILCACGTKNTDSAVSDISSEASNNSTSDDTSNNDNVKECFEKILNNEQSFYCTNRETNMLLSDYQNFSKDVSYAYVDMDNDNIDELAIWLCGGDTLILRKEDTSVIGYLFGIKGMSTIFTDGCFLWRQGAGETYGCSRLEFADKTHKEIELWRVENANSNSEAYYIDGKAVTKEELTSFNDGKEHQHITWNSWSTLQAGFDYSTKLHQENPEKYRDIGGELETETQEIIKIDGQYYQSYVASSYDMRYILISKSEYPEMDPLWNWEPIGTANVYSLELLGTIDEGYK